jgi:hypothetical protein
MPVAAMVDENALRLESGVIIPSSLVRSVGAEGPGFVRLMILVVTKPARKARMTLGPTLVSRCS